MRLKRRTKANIHFNDQDSQKRMAVKTEDIASTSGMRSVRSVDGFKQGSQIRMKGHKSSAHKITKCMTDNLVSSGCNIEMKKLQIILTRCDDKDFNLHNESAVEFNNNSREYNGIKSKSKTGKKQLKDSSKKNAREMKDILEITGDVCDVQKDDVEICHTSINNSGPSEIKSNSLKRSKRNRENNGEIDIGPEEIEIIHSKNKFRNGDVKRELKVNLEKYISIPENDKSLKLCGDSESSVDADEKAKNVPNETGKSRKRKKGEKQDDNDTKPAKSAKKEKDSDKSKSSKEKTHDVTSIDFGNDSKNSSGKKWNFKISSWNVNGIRAWLEKGSLSYLYHEKPDIICIQETKCSDDKLPEEIKKVEGYHSYWLSGDKDGYSGVGLLSKQEPIKVEYGIGISEHDNEGRVITAEYEQFYIVASYVPNAGRKLVRLEYRMKWDEDFRAYLKKLDAKKPVILCGDLNVAHKEIDLANPKTNKKNAGFTKEEREGFSTLLKEGFTDTFRHLYPDVTGAYTFWTYMMNARAKNVGWRLDYFVISERFTEKLCDNVIRKDVLGSDHCPITLFLSV